MYTVGLITKLWFGQMDGCSSDLLVPRQLPEVPVSLEVDCSRMNGCPLRVSEHVRHYPTLAFRGENIASASFLVFAGEALILSLSASFASFSAFFFSASACFVFSSKQRLNILTKLKRIEITARAPFQGHQKHIKKETLQPHHYLIMSCFVPNLIDKYIL